MIASRRTLHATRPTRSGDSLFSPNRDVEEEAPEPSTLEPAKPSLQETHPEASERYVTVTAKDGAKPNVHGRQKLRPEVRAARFESLFVDVSMASKRSAVGLNETNVGKRREGVGYGNLTRLMQLAQTKEEMERVVALLPGWNDSGRELQDRHTFQFLGAYLTAFFPFSPFI
jgi:hypothetical protein